MAERRVGPYVLLGVLGRGGMGEVWRALDGRKDRVVALKLLGRQVSDDAGFRARFRRESALAARLSDPNILPIHDYGEVDGRLFIEMPLVPGRDLAALLRSGPLGVPRAVRLVSQVGRALSAAHDDGLVHRDVKPSNVLVVGDPPDEHAYLIDFGIARALDGTRLSLSGALLGTPAYMAPERFRDEGDDRSDQYALACVLHEAVTGAPVFRAASALALMHAHLHLAPQLDADDAALPVPLRPVVARALDKDPDRRFPSVRDLLHALRAATRPPTGAAGPGPRASRAPAAGGGPTGGAAPPSAPAEPTGQAGPKGQAGPAEPTWSAAGPAAPPGPAAAARPSPVAVPPAERDAGVGSTPPPPAEPAGGAVPGRPPGPPPPGPGVARSRPRDPLAAGARRRRSRGAAAALAVLALLGTTGALLLQQAPPGGSSAGPTPGPPAAPAAPTTDGSPAPLAAGGSVVLEMGNVVDDIAVPRDGRAAWVSVWEGDGRTSRLFRIGALGEVEASFPLPFRSADIASSASGDRVYAAGEGVDEVAVLDAVAGAVEATIAVTGPLNPVVSPDGERVYVFSGAGNDRVEVIDTATNRITSTLRLPGFGYSLVVSDDSRRVFATTDTQIIAFDAGSGAEIGRVATGLRPVYDLFVAPDSRTGYGLGDFAGEIERVDLDGGTTRDPLRTGTFDIPLGVSPDGSTLYATSRSDGGGPRIAEVRVDDGALGRVHEGIPPGGDLLTASADGGLVHIRERVSTVRVFAVR